MGKKLLDKMIAGMECCQEIDGCSECPYRIGCIEEMDADILSYLKEQRNFISWMETLGTEGHDVLQ